MNFTFAFLIFSNLVLYGLLTLSSHLVQGLPLFVHVFTSDLRSLLVHLPPLIRSTYAKHLKNFQSTLSLIFSLAPTLRFTSFFLHLPIVVTPHIIRKEFISITSSFDLSSNLFPRVSATHIPNAQWRI